MTNRFFWLLILMTMPCSFLFSQGMINSNDVLGRDTARVISTAVPFLTISPDARSGGMGDVGVAISPDANSSYWNAAKLVFIDKKMGFALSYNPWLRKLVNDMSLNYLSGYYKPSKEEAIGIQMTYFDLGSLQFTNDQGQVLQDFYPQEFSMGSSYSRKLSENMGVALSLKYIHSNLSGGISVNNGTSQTKAGNSAAGDIGFFYKKDVIWSGRNTNVAFGANLSNIGTKISYTDNNKKNFIPTNLRVGTAITSEIDPFNKFTFALDLNKLMVPSTPVYAIDPATSERVIVRGKDPNRGLINGMLGSFTDAPDGAKEELREVIASAAVEYWYNSIFAARGGYFHENKMKGNRKYFTLGFGIRYNVFGLDFAYLVPLKQNNPLAETLRFTLHFAFEGKSLKEESIVE